MTKFLFLSFILLFNLCKTSDKENINKFPENKKIRFQIPIFEIKDISREEQIRFTEKFASSFTRHSGKEVIILDKKIKSDLILSRKVVPSTNYIINSSFTSNVFQVRIVDLESGEIISFGKVSFKDYEDLINKFDSLIEEQLVY